VVAANRRFMDPTGHFNRPDVFQLHVDTTERRASSVIDHGNPPDGEIARDLA
jgi:hypothetical protein